MTDWPALIGEIVLHQQEQHRRDPDVQPFALPHLGADDAGLHAATQRLGRPLDPLHAELLRYADGWDDVFVYTHLFTTAQLGVDGPWRAAEELLDIFYTDGPPPADLPGRDELYCLAADAAQVEDLFVVWTAGPVTDGGRPVSWLADEEVQRFANVAEWLRSVAAYLQD